jgi:uncharacterized membrane protein
MITFFRRYWIFLFSVTLGIFIGLPFLAPVLMHTGRAGIGKLIYYLYSWLCHQLPERSFFLYGPKLTYSLAEIQSAWQASLDPAVLRQFIGNPLMGWKVAWSDRMVSMYFSLWLCGIIWWPIRKQIKHLPLWGFLIFLSPMAVDGASHLLSDLAGIGQGFRYTNMWLSALTHASLPVSIYFGDAWGSFNSIMRLLSGLLFGVGVVWYIYPYLDEVLTPPINASKVLLTSHPLNMHDNIP